MQVPDTYLHVIRNDTIILLFCRDGFCDIRQEQCVKASVVAENLMSTPHLKCRYRRTYKVSHILCPYINKKSVYQL
jgi:hypothetical protein